MQEAPGDLSPEFQEMLNVTTRQYKDGATGETSYHGQMSILYSILKDGEKCRSHVALVPENADAVDKANAYISLGRILVYEKKLDEAITSYEKCLEADPEHEMALDEISWCCYHQKRYEEAEKWFRCAIALEDVDFESTWEGMGLTLAAMERYTEAIQCFHKALELDEDKRNVAYYEYLIGLSYSRENDFYRALAHYFKCLDADPEYAQALNNIGAMYYEHESDIKKAIEYFQKTEEAAEKNEDSQTLQLVYLNLIKLYNLLSEYDLSELYNVKLLSILGFPVSLSDEEEDDDDGCEEDEVE